MRGAAWRRMLTMRALISPYNAKFALSMIKPWDCPSSRHSCAGCPILTPRALASMTDRMPAPPFR